MKKCKDLTGLFFGKWEVIERVKNKKGKVYWLCKCECGTIRPVAGHSLTKGISLSCGCETHFQNIAGIRFGRLVVLEKHHQDKWRGWHWTCACDCGNKTIVSSHHLLQGHTKSCGCLKIETTKTVNFKHGYSRTKLGAVRNALLQRCYNTNDKGYHRYGGRGIQVCEEWRNHPTSFYDWAIKQGYKEDSSLSIERIDNNGNYEPSNCCWSLPLKQSNNRRNTIYLTLDGKTKPLAVWSKELAIPRSTLFSRKKRGWTDKDTLTKEINIKCRWR